MNATKAVHQTAGHTVTVYRPFANSPKHSQSDRSLLRYPGGKTRAVKTIRKYIPKGVNQLCAPFLGGASVELSCAADGIVVYGADAFEPLINFWQHAQAHSLPLSEQVRKYYPLSREKFYNLQKTLSSVSDPVERAAIFYVLNRSSFSGATLSGGMSPGHPRFTPSAIDRLRDFRADNIIFSCADFEDSLEAHADKFLYLDPPYANGERLYGHKGDMHDGFDHERLASHLKKRDGWILSYNDHPVVRHLYREYADKIHTPSWQYGMSTDKTSNELLIINV